MKKVLTPRETRILIGVEGEFIFNENWWMKHLKHNAVYAMLYRYGIRGRNVIGVEEIARIVGVSRYSVRRFIRSTWKHLIDEDPYLLKKFIPSSAKLIKFDAGIK